jgi:hypothetical protein
MIHPPIGARNENRPERLGQCARRFQDSLNRNLFALNVYPRGQGFVGDYRALIDFRFPGPSPWQGAAPFFLGKHQTLWERACSRWRRHIQQGGD